jgi:diguanylate cyclase (GGDEF)-like protein
MDNLAIDNLIVPAATLAPHTPTLHAYDVFSQHPALYAIAVVDDDGIPVGLLNRFKFLETLSRPFARELFKHQTVESVMDRTPLMVDERMALDELSEIFVDDGTKYIFDGFIVTRDGKYLGIGTGYSVMRCLTERKHAVLFHLAHHDPLTGLANRQLFADRLTHALAHARRNTKHLGLLCLDVDGLKAVNDRLGHAIGDLLLKSIADRLTHVIRSEDTVARLSGDEFTIILNELNTPQDAEHVAAKLLTALRDPHTLEGLDVNVSCSIGIAVFPDDATTQDSLMRAADAAAYHAKQFRNTCQRYSTEVQQSTRGGLPAFAWVRRAIDERHLAVFYQPQVHVHTGTLAGIEALVRWQDPERGLLPTIELVRLAEEAGLITSVTDVVLGTAMRQMLEWHRLKLIERCSLAVNISSVELRDGALIPVLLRHLRETGYPATALELEITESTAMLSGTSTAGVLKELTDLGVRLSIDDFGTGYSSLSRLQRLPVGSIKIDRGFVDDIEHHDAGKMAKAIISLAHSLGLTVTGEGVETRAQREFLRAHNCDRMQGYLICPPLPAEDATAHLRISATTPR